MVKPRKPFEFRSFTIHQEEVSLPVTTDACLFGSMVSFDQPNRILDMGCGSGLLMHMMHQKYPKAPIIGLDLHIESVNTSNYNFKFNGLESQLNSVIQDWWHYQPDILFDGIICNPPFFENHLASIDLLKRQARHTNGYELKELLPLVNNWLTPNGSCYILAPFISKEEVQQTWLNASHNLCFKYYQNIQSNKQNLPHLSVLGFSKRSQELESLPTLLVYEQPGKFSEEVKDLLKPFLQDRALN